MKFLSRINRQYLWTLSILLVVVSFLGYFILQNILENEIKEDIYEKEFAIENEIRTTGNLPNIYPIIETRKIPEAEVEKKSYKKVFLNDEAEGEEEPYLEYTNCVKINNAFYLIKLRHSLLETNDLIMAIALPLLLLLLLTFVASFFITKKLNKTIWSKFEDNLVLIANYSFNKSEALNLKPTNILEFDTLNDTLKSLTEKLKRDYITLKEFTENASHEIQTPISIILLNLEELLQQDLQKQSFKQVTAAITAIKRLSNLNQNLLLLAKIENKQFQADGEININKVVENKLEEFRPLLEKNHLKVNYISNADFTCIIHSDLANILFNNLISNAIKHNIKNGEIRIEINEHSLKICNTGEENSLSNDTIFNRFTKEKSRSHGLGLAIVKQICDSHELEITYSKTKLHCLTISK